MCCFDSGGVCLRIFVSFCFVLFCFALFFVVVFFLFLFLLFFFFFFAARAYFGVFQAPAYFGAFSAAVVSFGILCTAAAHSGIFWCFLGSSYVL